METAGRWRALSYLLVPLLIVAAVVETWALVRRPWRIDAAIGRADSALLGDGFYTKEIAEDGTPFRWTTGEATILLPWTQPAYRVILRADTTVTTTHRVEFIGCGESVLAADVQPGYHLYQFIWSPQCQRSWPGQLGSADLLLSTEARPLSTGDERSLGISLSALHVRGAGTGPFSAAPLLIVALCVAAAALLLRPWSPRRLLILAGVAAVLPPAFDLLAWHPPVGSNYTWLPVAWLPGLIAVVLVGAVLVRVVLPSRHGPLVAVALVGVLLLGLLVNLWGHWAVTGPDYDWHLNHGGSWERVFRAHAFYPFGFPLVLWLGQLWGDALAAGQTACLVATMIAFVATAALAWRLTDRAGAWLGALLFLGSPFLVAYGVLASSDVFLMAAGTSALLVLCWGRELRAWRLLLAGLLLGIAYLFRYQATVLLAGAALGLFGGCVEETDLPRRLRWLRRLGWFLPVILLVAGFLLGSAPQWMLDIRDMGRPFFSRQYVNIWYFGYKQFTLPAVEGNELWYMLNYDPPMLWRNWMANIHHSLDTTIHALLTWPLGLVALFGLVGAALDWRDRRRRLLFLWTGVYFLAVTLTANKERFFLPVVPVLVLLAALFLAKARDRLVAMGRWGDVLYQAVQVGLWCWSFLHLLGAEQVLALYGSNVLR